MRQLLVVIWPLLLGSTCCRTDYNPILDAGPPAIDSEVAVCDTVAGPATLALYQFDDTRSVLTDAVGSHPGQFVGIPEYVPGQAGCGTALRFDGQGRDYGVIDHSEAWNIDEGSVDFWFRPDAFPVAVAGLVVRDANDSFDAGPFSVELDAEGGLHVRVQKLGAAPSWGRICARPLANLGKWTHVGIKFGPPAVELWVDGLRFDDPETSVSGECQTGHAGGISGNNNLWIIGASNHTSDKGIDYETSIPFTGAIDRLRISDKRLDFSQ